MGYGKRDLARISLGLCLNCETPVVKRRRCTSCSAELAAQARIRYRAASRRKRRRMAQRIKQQRRLLAAKRLSYVTVKRRER